MDCEVWGMETAEDRDSWNLNNQNQGNRVEMHFLIIWRTKSIRFMPSIILQIEYTKYFLLKGLVLG